MLTRRTSLRSAIAILGVGAAIALSASTPAFAANEGNYPGNWGGCAATEEIQLRTVSGATHDWMEFFPTATGPNCLFDIINNNSVIWTSTGAGSGWIYDGPGNYLCPQIHDKATGVLKWQGQCN
ncbi:spermidine/putrescine-binding protein [Kitasatospora sp. MAP12-15]|uniref:hypothetical protein n=1 Tax=unclassified Kitasatospora TaxID=2633591 RepID=UPI0024747EE2|nr:hypothetical protein [Kitasatospora sp. MAP12-44]MDH6113572.1 spermidine/putrescine-binding protein [Kitasatospora sp. MAP12-44]